MAEPRAQDPADASPHLPRLVPLALIGAALIACVAGGIALRSIRKDSPPVVDSAQRNASPAAHDAPDAAEAPPVDGVPAESPGGLRCAVRGRVISRSPGELTPLAGARVRCSIAARPGDSASETVREGVSGADGQFEIAEVLVLAKPRFEVDAEGHAVEVFEIELINDPETPVLDLHDIVLERSCKLLVHVRAENDTAVDGAKVVARPDTSRPPGEAGPGESHFKDATRELIPLGEGSFEIDRLPPGRCLVEVVAKGFATKQRWIALPRPDALDITLSAGQSIRGIVIDGEGKALPGARVWIAEDDVDWETASKRSTADAEGRFALDDLPDGVTENLTVTHEGFARRVRESVDVGFEEVELVLLREGVITGRVLDRETEKPIELVLVTPVLADPFVYGDFIQSDAEGRFELRNLLPGSYELRFDRDGYLPISEGPIAMDEGVRVEGVIVRLETGVEQKGRVVDAETGQPIRGAEVSVSLLAKSDSSPGIDRSTRTGDDGSFELTGLVPGTYRVSAGATAQEPFEEAVTLPVDDWTIRLDAGGAISGAVLDPTGLPVPGVDVTLDVPRYFNPQELNATRVFARRLLFGRRCSTDRTGRYRFDQLPQLDCYSVCVEAAGYAPARLTEITAGPGVRRENADLHLTPGGKIRANIVDALGARLDHGSVEARRTDFRPGFRSDRQDRIKSVDRPTEGAFEISGLEPGPWIVNARVDEHGETQSVTVQVEGAETHEVTLACRPGLLLEGVVVDGEGLAVEGATIVADAGDRGTYATTDSLGRFVIKDLAESTAVVDASKGGYASMRRIVDLPTSGERWMLQKCATILGTLSAAGKKLLPCGEVEVLDLSSERIPGTVSDVAGRFICTTTLRHAILRANVPGFAERRVTLDLVPGERRRVSIALVDGGDVECKVVDAETGAPLEHVAVKAEIPGADGFESFEVSGDSNEDGDVSFSGLPPTAARFTAYGEGYRPARLDDVRIEAGKKTPVRIELARAQGIYGTVQSGPRRAADVPVVARDLAKGTETRAVTLEDGDFELIDLEPGEYELRAGPAPGDASARVAVDRIGIAAGECSRIFLDLQSVLFEGRVTGLDAPIEKLWIAVIAVATGEWVRNDPVGADGTYSLRLPGEGEYWLRFDLNGKNVLSTRITVPPGTAVVQKDFNLGE